MQIVGVFEETSRSPQRSNESVAVQQLNDGCNCLMSSKNVDQENE